MTWFVGSHSCPVSASAWLCRVLGLDYAAKLTVGQCSYHFLYMFSCFQHTSTMLNDVLSRLMIFFLNLGHSFVSVFWKSGLVFISVKHLVICSWNYSELPVLFAELSEFQNSLCLLKSCLNPFFCWGNWTRIARHKILLHYEPISQGLVEASVRLPCSMLYFSRLRRTSFYISGAVPTFKPWFS